MREHLFPALRGLPSVRVVHVASRSGETARRFAHEHDIDHWSEAWQGVIEADLDGVVVAGPPKLHANVLHAALSAGLPVYVEKPPTPDLATLRPLIELEKNCSALAFVGYNFRFAELIQELFRRVDQPRYLRLRFVTSKPQTPFWGLPTVFESYLLAVAIHAVETALWRFGDVRELVTQYQPLAGESFVADVGMSFRSGASAHLELGNYSHRFDCRWELMGEDGSIAMVDNLDRLRLVPAESDRRTTGWNPKSELELALSGLHGGQGRGGYHQALASFVDCIREERPSPSPLAASEAVYQVLDSLLDRWKTHPSQGTRSS